MIADWYKRHGYQFLTLSDHNVLSDGMRWIDVPPGAEAALENTRPATAKRGWSADRIGERAGSAQAAARNSAACWRAWPFSAHSGEEITHKFGKAPVHMNGINLRDVVKPSTAPAWRKPSAPTSGSSLSQDGKTGWPNVRLPQSSELRLGSRAEDMVLAEEADVLRSLQRPSVGAQLRRQARPGCERMWDIALALRLGKSRLPVVYGLATDDAHGYHALPWARPIPAAAGSW